MRTKRLSASWVLSGVVCLAAITAATLVSEARGDEWYELNGKALSSFEFDGLPLPTSPEQLKREYPDAEPDHERVDESIGLACYVVRDLKNADAARFFFCDGQLYQFEAEYSKTRIAKLGGERAMLQKLVDTWGPADHAGESRRTWQRPMYARRADFYLWPGRAQLIITDMSWMPIVAQRVVRAEKKAPAELGF